MEEIQGHAELSPRESPAVWLGLREIAGKMFDIPRSSIKLEDGNIFCWLWTVLVFM